MGTEILKSFGNLQHELEEARSSLKGVDESIKRLIGRDPSELPPRNVQKRPLDDKGRPLKPATRIRNFAYENVEPPLKRSHISVFKRLSDKVSDDDHHLPQKGLISKVIVTPKEVPSRQQALDAQNKDEKFRARNKRMFGALLGTLQKFQQEETKLKQKEQKRAELEKKIEEHEIKEKEDVRKERQELFFNRKKKQAEIKVIELKMLRMKEYTSWEQSQKPRMNYILTKAKPHIHYLPRKTNEQTKKLLEESNKKIEEILNTKKKQISDELQHIEDKMRKNFDYKFGHKEEKEVHTDSHRRNHDNDEPDQEDQYEDVHTEPLNATNEEINNKNEKENQESPDDSMTKESQDSQENGVHKSSEIPMDISADTFSEITPVVNEDTDGVNNTSTNLTDVTGVNIDLNTVGVNDVLTGFQSAEFQSDYNLDVLQSMYDPQASQSYDQEAPTKYNPQESQCEYNLATSYNSQEVQEHNFISVQMGNFGPQTSD